MLFRSTGAGERMADSRDGYFGADGSAGAGTPTGRPPLRPTEDAAERVLTFAVESLDMLKSVTQIFGESVEKAESCVSSSVSPLAAHADLLLQSGGSSASGSSASTGNDTDASTRPRAFQKNLTASVTSADGPIALPPSSRTAPRPASKSVTTSRRAENAHRGAARRPRR